MSEEISKILDKFDKVLENYELDKKCGQISTDSICHLFPSEIITIKDYMQQKENIIKEVREYNKSILKERWYGGNEKEYAKHNLEILDKEGN